MGARKIREEFDALTNALNTGGLVPLPADPARFIAFFMKKHRFCRNFSERKHLTQHA